MTVGKSAKSEQRLPQDKAAEQARDDKAPNLQGAGGPQDSEVIQSAVAALGASILGAGVGEAEERERARKRGLRMDNRDDAGPEGKREHRDLAHDQSSDESTEANGSEQIPGVSGRLAGRDGPAAPAQPTLSADELQRRYREDQPGEASARQADPDAAPTPLQRLEEDGDFN